VRLRVYAHEDAQQRIVVAGAAVVPRQAETVNRLMPREPVAVLHNLAGVVVFLLFGLNQKVAKSSRLSYASTRSEKITLRPERRPCYFFVHALACPHDSQAYPLFFKELFTNIAVFYQSAKLFVVFLHF